MTTTRRPPRIVRAGGREIRTFASTLEARDGTGPLEFRIEGYASVVDQPYEMGAYTETIASGAFTASLAQRPDVQLLVNHENLPLARTTIPPGQPGHLSLTEDSRGLRVSAQLDRSDPDAVTLVKKIRAGLLDQMSFAFKVTKQQWSDDGALRTIQAVDINRGDVSVVNQGANSATSVDARSRARSTIAALDRMRHLRIANEAGRRRPSLSTYRIRAEAARLRGRRPR